MRIAFCRGVDVASPAVCTLPMVPCGSSPVTRARLYHAKNEAPEEEDGQTLLNGHPLNAFLNVIY